MHQQQQQQIQQQIQSQQQKQQLFAPVFFVLQSQNDSKHPLCIHVPVFPVKPTVKSFADVLFKTIFSRKEQQKNERQTQQLSLVLMFTVMETHESKFTMQTFHQDSVQLIPYDNRENVIFVKIVNRDVVPYLPRSKSAFDYFALQGIDQETLSIIKKNDITESNMKFLSLEALEHIGIKSWGKRVHILNLVRDFYQMHGITLTDFAQALANPSIKRKDQSQGKPDQK